MLKVREARPTDMDELVQLCKAHAAYEGGQFNDTGKRQLASLLFSSKALHCLVAEWDGQLMGYTTFAIQYATWSAGAYLYMDCLYLKEKARGKGTGRLLMQRIAAFMKANDLKQAQWQTPIDNSDAIAFYHQIGATDLSKARFFWEP